MIDLQGKAALVTGASRGIGAATVRRLCAAGASVVLFARSGADLDTVRLQIAATGGEALAIPGDVTSYADVTVAVTTAVDRFGRLDILVNNAGLIDPIARLADSDPDAWGQVVDINLRGVYHGIRAVLPVMLAQGTGTIINISSGAATSALEGWSHYCATKAAVLSLTRVVDKEYRDEGVRSIGLSPGTVATAIQESIRASGINPVSRLDWGEHISPEWAAEAVAWLCSDAGTPYVGTDFSIKTEEGRRLVGLV